jgi:hypothetical protein
MYEPNVYAHHSRAADETVGRLQIGRLKNEFPSIKHREPVESPQLTRPL